MRLDESELEELRQWAHALRTAGSEESAAAGRAILLLLEELERVRLELRLAGSRAELEDHPVEEVDPGASAPVSSTLQQRLQRVLGRDSAPSSEGRPQPAEEVASDVDVETDGPAQSWIETLRRQK